MFWIFESHVGSIVVYVYRVCVWMHCHLTSTAFYFPFFIACILSSIYAAGQLPYAARKQLVLCSTDFGCFINAKIKKLNLPEIKRLTFLLQEIIPWVDNISHWAQKDNRIKLCRPNKGWKLPTKRLAKT